MLCVPGALCVADANSNYFQEQNQQTILKIAQQSHLLPKSENIYTNNFTEMFYLPVKLDDISRHTVFY